MNSIMQDFWKIAVAEEERKKFEEGFIVIPRPLQKYLGNHNYIHRDDLERLRNFLSVTDNKVVPHDGR